MKDVAFAFLLQSKIATILFSGFKRTFLFNGLGIGEFDDAKGNFGKKNSTFSLENSVGDKSQPRDIPAHEKQT